MDDYVIDGIEYTLVDTYIVPGGRLVQLNSDDDIALFFVDENGKLRGLTPEEDKEYREKFGLVDYEYVTFSPKDLYNHELGARQVDRDLQEEVREYLFENLDNIYTDLGNDPYVKHRLQALRYKYHASGNSYLSNCVYLVSDDHPGTLISWVPIHETIHGIVNKNRITNRGIIEGITDMFTGELIRRGNYSQRCQLYGSEFQINDSGYGQNHLVVFAKQLVYALGDEYNVYEMFAYPHKQIDKFGEIYGRSKNRILNHKINKLYRHYDLESFKEAQRYMLETVFDKKFENVCDEESAKEYFEQLINFGLLRGRIEGKDDDLKEYYNRQLGKLSEKGIDSSIIPEYTEKPFYPSGDVYLRYPSYMRSSIQLRKEGKGKDIHILYNKDRTCVYIIVDGKLHLIQNDSYDNPRRFMPGAFNESNSRVELLENGHYLITAPDGVTEEVVETEANERINRYFERLEQRNSSKVR